MAFLKIKFLNRVKQTLAFTFLYLSIAITLLVLIFILSYIFVNGLYTVKEKEESFIYLEQTLIEWKGKKYGLWINTSIKCDNLTYGELQNIFTGSARNWAYLTEQRYPLVPILYFSQENQGKNKANWLDFLSPQRDRVYQNRVKVTYNLEKSLELMENNRGSLLLVCLNDLNERELEKLKKVNNLKQIKYRPYVLTLNLSDKENNNEWHLDTNRWNDLRKKGHVIFNERDIKVNEVTRAIIDTKIPLDSHQVALIRKEAELEDTLCSSAENEAIIMTGRCAQKADKIRLFWKKQTRAFSLTWDYFTSSPFEGSKFGGISFIIINTLLMILGTSVLAIPLGVCSALYLVHYSRKGSRLSSLIRIAFDILSSLPAIIFGLFGMTIFVPVFGLGLASGCLSTTLMILPNITKASEVALKAVPKEIYHASLSLGATKFTSLFKVVLPCSAPGIITGIILAIGRAFSEAAVLLFTLGTSLTPIENCHTSGRVLTVHLYLILQEGGMTKAFPVALVIVITVLILNIIADSIRDRFGRQMKNN